MSETDLNRASTLGMKLIPQLGELKEQSTADIRDEHLRLGVANSGIGMTEEKQAKVFQAFVQADGKTSVNKGGTGLGLAIVSNFCDMLGGLVEPSSTPGKGSRFDVSLPIAPM